MSDVALTISLLSLVAILGLGIGHIRLRGVSLGIGGVLFGGIIVGHFLTRHNFALNEHTMHFIQEFGLILFVYTIGIQVGPGFFSSLRQSGLRLNGMACFSRAYIGFFSRAAAEIPVLWVCRFLCRSCVFRWGKCFCVG